MKILLFNRENICNYLFICVNADVQSLY